MARKKIKVQFKLRISEELRKRIETCAKAEHRSMNSEMIMRLERSFGGGNVRSCNHP